MWDIKIVLLFEINSTVIATDCNCSPQFEKQHNNTFYNFDVYPLSDVQLSDVVLPSTKRRENGLQFTRNHDFVVLFFHGKRESVS